MDTSDIAVEVAPVDLAPGELGLIAKGRLEPGDILAWAPTSLLLNKAKAVGIWGEIAEPLSDRVAISLLLVHERFVRGADSPWVTYVATLPGFDGDVSGPSFLWEEEEWEGLVGSDGYVATVQMHNTLVDEFDELRATLFAKHPVQFPAATFSWRNYQWAAACVASRAYGDDADGSNLAIAPLVDFLNHRAGALQLTRFGGGIVAYAHTGYAPGEQVFVSYGGKSNAQLLTQYGFVDSDNLDEAIYLRIGAHLDIESPHVEAKRRLLEELLDQRTILRLSRRPREWDAELLPTVRALALGLEDFVPASCMELRAAQTPRLEAAALGLLEKALERRLEEYPSTLEQAREELEVPGLPERQALGLRLRISEQELLAEAVLQVADRREVALAELAEITQV